MLSWHLGIVSENIWMVEESLQGKEFSWGNSLEGCPDPPVGLQVSLCIGYDLGHRS